MWKEGYRWLFYSRVWQFNFAGFFDIFRIKKYGKVILLQSVIDCYYEVRQILQSVTHCYYKVPQVLQSVTDFIIKCVKYCKVWQNETWHNPTSSLEKLKKSIIWYIFLINWYKFLHLINLAVLYCLVQSW